jgi:phosphoserine phosphatase
MMETDSATVDRDLKPKGIVFFDYDGVLNKGSSWRAVHKTLDTVPAANEQYDQYYEGEISFAEWGHLDASLWSGTCLERFYEATEQIELVGGINETVTTLKQEGFIAGVVSGGVHQLIEASVRDCGFDFIIANEVAIENGHVSGAVSMDVTKGTKLKYYQHLADRYAVSLDRSVTIGDSEDDFQPMERGLNIAFNADNVATRSAADIIIEADDLRRILTVVEKWLAEVSATDVDSSAAADLEPISNDGTRAETAIDNDASEPTDE